MKKEYLSPYAEPIVLTHESFLMSSVDGDLGDLGEIIIITDSVIDHDDFDLLLF